MIDWSAVAAIAQVAATVVAAGAFVYLAKQVRGGNRAEDLRSLYDFYQRAEDVEARLHREPEGPAALRVRYELLNFLEVSAEAYLRNLYGRVSSGIVCDKLIDSIAFVWADAPMRGIIQSGVTSDSTFSGIVEFYRLHRRKIDALVEARRATAIPEAMPI